MGQITDFLRGDIYPSGAYTQAVVKLAAQAELQCLLPSLTGPHAHQIAFIPNVAHNPTHMGPGFNQTNTDPHLCKTASDRICRPSDTATANGAQGSKM